MNSKGSEANGFSLIELIIVVATIGILAAIALPIGKEYFVRSNRSAAKSILQDVVSTQEQYVMQNRAYFFSCTDACPASPASPADVLSASCVAQSAGMFAPLGVSIPEDVHRAYDFAICAPDMLSATGPLKDMPVFQVVAVPKAGTIQEDDSFLWMNQFGLRMPTSKW